MLLIPRRRPVGVDGSVHQYFVAVLVFAFIELCLAVVAIVNAEKVCACAFLAAARDAARVDAYRGRMQCAPAERACQIPTVARTSWETLFHNDPDAIADIEKAVRARAGQRTCAPWTRHFY